jgi:hypothetical protein
VRAILADVNLLGHVQILLRIWRNEEWREIWDVLNLAVLSFEDLGLTRRDPDSLIWRACQQHQVVLLTANRNADDPDSLEATIRSECRPESLPVITVADELALIRHASYAQRVAEKLLEIFLAIDNYRGTGRLYVP